MLTELLASHPKILAECAVAERLRRRPRIALHPTLFNTPLIYGPEEAKAAMSSIYIEYLDAASQANLPLILTAPTWRLDRTRILEAGMPESINADAVAYLLELCESHPPTSPVLVVALTGPKNDCYRPDLAPDTEEARSFHSIQIEELAATKAEFLLAQT
ncbi:homocysteine S-methyltransferase family protein, partial [Haloferula sp.]|uniref:homocysteine S-methyltransferase family protein n=1 Tax=Haloferula sp. TaxID=2497595 RepID=UPI003C726BEA